MVVALEVAALTSPAGLAHADARVHGLLLAMDARRAAVGAHPALLARLAHGVGQRVVAVAAVEAVGLPWAVWRFTAWSSPARVALTHCVCSVALAVARARLANTHAFHVGQAAHSGRLDTIQARSVSRAARHVAQLAPEALVIVTDAQLLVLIVLAVIAALCVASDSRPAVKALAHARVGRALNPLNTGLVTRVPHPRPNAVNAAHNVVVGRIARAAVVTVWLAGTVWDVTSNALPARVACARVVGVVAFAVAGAVEAKVTGAARNVTQRAAPAREPIALALASLVQGTVSRAFPVAALAGPARVAHAVARVGGLFCAMHTRLVAANAHPALVAVNAARVLVVSAACAATKAVWLTRTVWRATVNAVPANVAHALVEVCIAGTVAVALAVWARATRKLTQCAVPHRVAGTLVIDTGAMRAALALTERAMEARVADALVCNTRALAAALLRAKLAIKAWVTDTLAQRAACAVAIACRNGVALVLTAVSDPACVTLALAKLVHMAVGAAELLERAREAYPAVVAVAALLGCVPCAVSAALVTDHTRAAAVAAVGR